MTGRQRGALAATGLGLFLVFLDAMIANLALPDIQAEFGGGESTMQWVVVAYSVGMALAIMPSGTLADRRGRRIVFSAAVLLFGLASAASGLAPALWVLVGARFVQGLAAAAISVTSLALVTATFPDEGGRARAIGAWNGIAAAGLALGPTLGGLLTEEASWRWVFLISVPVVVVVLVLTSRFVDESRDDVARGFDGVGQVLFGVAVVALSVGVVAGPHRGWLSPLILGLLVGAAVALVAFVRWERGRDQPMMDVHLFADGGYAWAIAAIFSVFFLVYGALLVVTQYWQNVRDFTPIEAGGLMLPFAIVMMLGPPRVGRWVGEVGPFRPAKLGLAVLLAGSLVLIGVIHLDLLATAAFVVMAVGVALAAPSLTSLAMSRVPEDRAGMGSGIFSAQRAIGSTVGYAVMGSILAGWLGLTLGDALEPVLTDPTQRSAVEASIIDNANPYAYAAEIGPGEPIPSASAATQDSILAAAKGDFADGIQVSLAVGSLVVLGALLAGVLRYARAGPDDGEAEVDDGEVGPDDA